MTGLTVMAVQTKASFLSLVVKRVIFHQQSSTVEMHFTRFFSLFLIHTMIRNFSAASPAAMLKQEINPNCRLQLHGCFFNL